MPSISATAERRRSFDLVDDVCESHTQVLIRGQRGNAVLVSADDWRTIQETLDLKGNSWEA